VTRLLFLQRQPAERAYLLRRLERRYAQLHLNYRSCFVLNRVGMGVKMTQEGVSGVSDSLTRITEKPRKIRRGFLSCVSSVAARALSRPRQPYSLRFRRDPGPTRAVRGLGII
jgi:hypothetical protein